MKKIFSNNILKRGLILSSVFALLSAESCKKYTELNPINSLSESTAFTTPANIELVAAGVYSTASYGFYYSTIGGSNSPRGYAFGAAAIEQSEMRGEDMVNLATFYQITNEATYDPTTANNVNMFNNLYGLINQANILITGVEAAAAKGTITTAVATQYEAEGRFLRALAHHELVINFCRPYVDGKGANPGVPYRTQAVNSTDAVNQQLSLGRGTVADDYKNILSDLDYAETNLPVKNSVNGITRASKGAAIALKTRVKLHMEDFAGVITEGAKLGATGTAATYTSPIGGYTLTASPDGPFTSFASNTESVFSIENSAASNGGVNGALPNMFGGAAYIGQTTTFGGRGLVATAPNLYNASFWVTGDKRRTLMQIQASTSTAKFFYNYKYRDPTNKTDYAPIVRYAEVLLNVAEAFARTTPLDPKALSLLNAVRNRSVPAANQYASVAVFASGDALTQAILNERRVEFAGEGRRWSDITRLSKSTFAVPGGGIPAKTIAADLKGDGSQYDIVNRPVVPTSKAAIPYSDNRFLWPIPVQEINANPNFAQNPGY
jgi:hypothetical protein